MVIRKKQQKPSVADWLKELEVFDREKYAIVESARRVVHGAYPEVGERIMYGGIMFTNKEDFGGLFVSTGHVAFEFSNGYKLKDPKKLLEGTGKYRRHLKLKTRSDVAEKGLEYFVKQVGF